MSEGLSQSSESARTSAFKQHLHALEKADTNHRQGGKFVEEAEGVVLSSRRTQRGAVDLGRIDQSDALPRHVMQHAQLHGLHRQAEAVQARLVGASQLQAAATVLATEQVDLEVMPGQLWIEFFQGLRREFAESVVTRQAVIEMAELVVDPLLLNGNLETRRGDVEMLAGIAEVGGQRAVGIGEITSAADDPGVVQLQPRGVRRAADITWNVVDTTDIGPIAQQPLAETLPVPA